LLEDGRIEENIHLGDAFKTDSIRSSRTSSTADFTLAEGDLQVQNSSLVIAERRMVSVLNRRRPSSSVGEEGKTGQERLRNDETGGTRGDGGEGHSGPARQHEPRCRAVPLDEFCQSVFVRASAEKVPRQSTLEDQKLATRDRLIEKQGKNTR